MRDADVEQWLALHEPGLIGQPKKVAVAEVAAAGLIPCPTYYSSEAPGTEQSKVVILLLGQDGCVRRVQRG